MNPQLLICSNQQLTKRFRTNSGVLIAFTHGQL